MRSLKVFMAIAVVLILTGCSTTPISFDKAIPVPHNKIYDKSFISSDKEKEKIMIIRDQGLFGSGCTHTIFINNKKSFDLGYGQALMVALEPGNHVLRLESGVGICPDTSISESTYLKLGEPQTFRVSISSNGQIMLSRIE